MAEQSTSARMLARNRGETTYRTGQPCKHGHVCARYVADTKCLECIAIKAKANWQKRKLTHSEIDKRRWADYRDRNREKIRDYGRSVQSLPRRLAAQKRWRDANREHELARKKQYRVKNRAAQRAKDNARNAANPERRRAIERANRQRNRERYNAVKREWSRNNLDKVALKARRRRARHAGADGWHTSADIDRIRALQNDRCAYCRVDLKGAGYVDHIVALANGGSNWPRNLQLTCLSCNSSKRAEDPIEFARRIGRLL